MNAATPSGRIKALLEQRSAHPEHAAMINAELALLGYFGGRGGSSAARAERRPAHRDRASYR